MTTVKPSGTVSILAGESPGVHWTVGGEYFNRAIRFANSDPMLPLFKMANYRVEPASESPNTTSVVFFPIKSSARRSEKDVSIYEKMALAATAQRYWSDNSVSVTISFNPETETQHVGTVLHRNDSKLIFLVNPHKESLVVIVENTTSLGPFSLKTAGFEVLVTTLEQEMVSDELFALVLSHLTKRVVLALKLTFEGAEGLSNLRLNFKTLITSD
jgi:hypothetical protein